jgi:acyl-CoA synthetase (AMP-forming)/AMP-acid ligase II
MMSLLESYPDDDRDHTCEPMTNATGDLQVVVSRMVEGPVMRLTYQELHERARLCALALRALGVEAGDRVGTMAWNTCRHVEAW